VTNPEQTPDTDLEAEELTDESLEDISGGVQLPYKVAETKLEDSLTTNGSEYWIVK
jgi:hypothetical protein